MRAWGNLGAKRARSAPKEYPVLRSLEGFEGLLEKPAAAGCEARRTRGDGRRGKEFRDGERLPGKLGPQRM